MVLFSDAVVAIAITLLILPLVDIASDHDLTVGSLFQDYGGQLVACGVSFAVIAQYWVNHHDLFSRIDRQTPSILWTNLLWLATIVFLPLPTEMLANDPHGDRSVQAFYIGSVLAASLALTLVALLAQRVARADGREIRVSFVTSAAHCRGIGHRHRRARHRHVGNAAHGSLRAAQP